MRLLALLAAAAGVSSEPQAAAWAALFVAIGTAVAGVVHALRLRQDRPKVIEEVAALHEGRLADALRAAWDEAERLRQVAAGYRDELVHCHTRIVELERREGDLEQRLGVALERITALEHP